MFPTKIGGKSLYILVPVVAALTSEPFLQLNLFSEKRHFEDHQFEPAKRTRHLASVLLQTELRQQRRDAENLASLTKSSLIPSPQAASVASGVELFASPDKNTFEENRQQLPRYNISNAQKAIRHPPDESPSTTKGTPNVKDVPETSEGATVTSVDKGDKGQKKTTKEQTKTTPNKRKSTPVPTRTTPSREAKRKLTYTETEETEETEETGEKGTKKGRQILRRKENLKGNRAQGTLRKRRRAKKQKKKMLNKALLWSLLYLSHPQIPLIHLGSKN